MPMLAWLLGAALSASAHDFYPIRPVRVTLRVEPDRVVADLRADSIIWIEEVTGLHPMPPADWSAETLAKVEGYANSHFTLQAGGKTAPGKLAEARYRQLPWEVNEEGSFFLRLVYPAVSPGTTLTGSARFYEEYRKELEGELNGRPAPYAEGYRTVVTIPGRKTREFTLTPAEPAFSFSADDARRPALAMGWEGFRRGAQAAFGAASGFPVLLAIALCLGAERKTALRTPLTAAAGGFLLSRVLDWPPGLIWVAVLVPSLAVIFVPGRPAKASAWAAALLLGVSWGKAALPLLPHSPLALPLAAAGAALAGALLFAAVLYGVEYEHRRLAAISESRVAELFARRASLTATALAMVGAYGLWQSFPR